MITVTEISPPLKISGLSSIIVQFEFNQYIVDTLKGIPTYYYHKKTKQWEVPVAYLGRLLDALTFYDDIQLRLLDTPKDCKFRFNKKYNLEPLSEDEIKAFKATPFKHQITAVNFMLAQEKSLLLDAPGVGKSLEMILFAETLKKRGLIDHCLVITGVAGLRANFAAECQKFTDEKSIIIGKYVTKTGNIRYRSMEKRAEQLREPIDEFFVLLNVQALRDKKIIEAINNSKNNFGLIMFDESHLIGATNTSQYENLLKLNSDFKVAATGSLIVNSPLSSLPSLKFTENDNAIVTTFKSQYCIFGGFKGNQCIGFKNLDVLREEIDNCSIRRTIDDIRDDIPAMNVRYEILEMEEDQRKFYEAVKEGVRESCDLINLKSANLLALTTRLRQATACPNVLTTDNIESVKVNRAVELIEELVSQGEKVAVMSVFKEPLNILGAKLDQLQIKYSINTGDTPDPVVAANVDRFMTDASEQVILGSARKLGTGYTINSASYLICIDTPYTFALFDQVCRRIYRVNNTRPAFIIVLLCEETIDERVRQIVETKRDLGEYLTGDSDEATCDSLNDELRRILMEL